MIEPAKLDIRADRRVACNRTLPFVGIDLGEASFNLQVRQTRDTDGDPLLDLATVDTAAAEGVRTIIVATASVAEHIAAKRLPATPPGLAASDVATVSVIGIRINETSMEGLPFPAERGLDARFVWDLLITPAGGIKDRYVGGDFIVRAGVTL